MKKLFVTFLCIAMVAVFLPAMAFAATTTEVGADLNEAIASAQNGDTLKLTADITEDITVPQGKTVTIDLNGHKITAVKDHTITNNGVLTVVGNGTVENYVKAKAALYTAPGAETVLNNGTFTGNTWYVIKNLGTLTIDGATVDQQDAGSSGIDNGYYGNLRNDCGVAYPASANVKLTIKSGYLSGGMNTVKNDDFGVLVVENGVFSNTSGPTILNWNETSIYGGSFTVNDSSKAVIANGSFANDADKGNLTIYGGQFTASNDGNNAIFGYGQGGKKGGAVEVKGGAFTGYVGSAADYPYTPTIEGGAFTNLDRETVVVNSDASANFVTEGEKIEVVGSVYINAALEELEKELTPEELASVKLEITEAAAGVEFKVPSGITVKNLTEENVNVNDETLGADQELVVKGPETDTPPTGDNDDGNKNEEPKKDTVPKTSDVNNMLPWVMVMALTAGAAVAFKKKEN